MGLNESEIIIIASMPIPESVRKPSDNKSRRCYVDEKNISLDFKNLNYSSMFEIEFENNNTICAMKELHWAFLNQDLVKLRINRYTAGFRASLEAEYAELIGEIKTEYLNLKVSSIKRLQEFFLRKSKELDTIVRRAYPASETTEDKSKFIEKFVLQNKVILHNTLAEEKRRGCFKENEKWLNFEITRNFTDERYTQPPAPCCSLEAAAGANEQEDEQRIGGRITFRSGNDKPNYTASMSTADPDTRAFTSVMNELPTHIDNAQPVVEVIIASKLSLLRLLNLYYQNPLNYKQA